MTTQNITYRLLQVVDKNLYRQIRLKCLQNAPENFGITYKEELNKKSLKFDEAIDNPNSPNFIYGAFDNAELIGICGFTLHDRLKKLNQGDISQFYVTSAYTGKGIGNSLLRNTINKAFNNLSLEQILLAVMSENEAAISFYKKLGFVKYGLIENYFKQGEKYWSQLFMVLKKENYLKERELK
ncbi:MAG: GNAT family protein [Ferruginibacter sp.]